MEKHRTEKIVEDTDYENIIKKKRLRELRGRYSGKQHLIANLKARKGMQLLKKEDRLRTFSKREARMKKDQGIDDLLEWENYLQRSDRHQEKLMEMKPDIVQRINEHLRLKKENERREKEKLREEMKLNQYSGGGDWYWESETEPDDENISCYSILTKEEKDDFEKEEKREREAMANRLKQEQGEKRKQEREKLKEAASKPIDPIPTRELCQYEQIREDIIREREEAMAKFKFYENLEETNKSIGFYGKDKT